VKLDDHAFVAWRAGENPASLVVYGFPREPAGHLFYQAPDAARAARIEAASHTHDTFTFPEQRVTASVGGKNISMNVRWTRHLQEHLLRAEVNHQGVTYRLEGQPARLAPGNAPLPALPLIQPAALDFTLLALNGKPHLAGRIRMGPYTLHPGEGLDPEVDVELKKTSGASIARQTVTHREDPSGFTLLVPLAGIQTGDRFTLRANANPGPVIGPLAFEQEFER
jgi:hypothetical protein